MGEEGEGVGVVIGGLGGGRRRVQAKDALIHKPACISKGLEKS